MMKGRLSRRLEAGQLNTQVCEELIEISCVGAAGAL